MQALSAQGTTYSLDYWSLSEIKSVISILPQNRNVAGGLQLSVRGVLSLHQKQMKGTYGFIGEFSRPLLAPYFIGALLALALSLWFTEC